jgi:hypothetical protein
MEAIFDGGSGNSSGGVVFCGEKYGEQIFAFSGN